IVNVNNMAVLNMTEELAEKISQDSRVAGISKYIASPTHDIFPHNNKWSVDNFGPLIMPKQGATADINTENIGLYKRIIEVYEGSELGIDNVVTLSGNQVLLNNQPLTQYTFLHD